MRVIPGHEIVGRVDAVGPSVEGFTLGQRVGIPWLGHTCGQCWYCRHDAENLCDAPQFTGYTRPGGYAERGVANARFAFGLGEDGDDVALAPLLCAGLIGRRSLVKAGPGPAPGPLDAAILYAPAGELVPAEPSCLVPESTRSPTSCFVASCQSPPTTPRHHGSTASNRAGSTGSPRRGITSPSGACASSTSAGWDQGCMARLKVPQCTGRRRPLPSCAQAFRALSGPR
nr:alcohol dehydrogenase catalytic domain-containing protein [Azotobacter beijerinckii]